MKMNEEIVIGKLLDEGDYVHIAYPSMTGIRDARIPRDAIGRRENLSGGRVAILVHDTAEFRVSESLGGAAAPYHVTEEHIRIVSAFEYNEALDEEDMDDEMPDFGNDTEAPAIILLGEDGEAPTAQDHEVWNQGLLAGGRRDTRCDWRFEPVRRPAFVFMSDPEDGGNMAPTAAAVNDASGKPAAYHIFNPDLSSAQRPMGALLGTFSKDYYPMAYEKGFGPILKYAEENGWKATVTSYNDGKVARLDCDVSQAGHTKDATRIRMGSLGRHFDESVTGDIIEGLSGLYRYGFTIHNSLDGTRAYRIQATAMRAKCSNMQMFDTAKANILSLKHDSTMKEFDFDNLGEQINEVILAAQQELVNMELLKHVPVSNELLERIMTLSEKKGIITKPKVTHSDPVNGVRRLTAVNRGYMWRLLGHGMTHPSEPWVAVSGEERGSLFHVYNVLTGALTHKPTYTEAAGATQKGRTLSFGALDKRLKDTHKMLMSIGKEAITGYANSEVITDVEGLAEHVRNSDMLSDVPAFSDYALICDLVESNEVA